MSSNSGGWDEPEFMFRDPGEEEDYQFAKRRQAQLDAEENPVQDFLDQD